MGSSAASSVGHFVHSTHSVWYVSAMEHLITVVQELSHARTLEDITHMVRHAARELTAADGATFVLRDGHQCYYVDEDAISPLWKGQRFPMEQCISGWVMTRAMPVIIENIEKDARIPQDVYRQTFVKSMAMVPIRRRAPIGAIGVYWADRQNPSDEIVAVLQALADTASLAIENAQLYKQQEQQMLALQESNYELSRFAWVASHDLEEPLRRLTGHTQYLKKHYAAMLDTDGRNFLENAAKEAQRLQELTEELLTHAQVEKQKNFKPLGLDSVLDKVLASMEPQLRVRGVLIDREPLPWVWGDPALLERLLGNLISNAVKFTGEGVEPVLVIRSGEKDNARWEITLADNGIGIDPSQRERVFGLFQRVHSQDVYPGAGLGLATCRKIAALHSGSIWLEAAQPQGTCVHLTLPMPEKMQDLL